jgi:hypothetical protein
LARELEVIGQRFAREAEEHDALARDVADATAGIEDEALLCD